MAFTNLESKEIHCKLIYLGSSGSGKSENLKSVYKSTANQLKESHVEFVPKTTSTKTFDFLPLSLGKVEGYHIKFHLFSFSLPMSWDALPAYLLRGVDGFVYVADSRSSALEGNQFALDSVKSILIHEGYDLEVMPKVMQFNKRDIPSALSRTQLSQSLNQGLWPEVEASAIHNVGTMETLLNLGRQVIYKLAPM